MLTDRNPENKLVFLLVAALAGYCLILALTNLIWYEGHTTADFHFFNDWAEWHGLDKVGHFFTAFHISDAGIHALLMAGISRKKAIIGGSFAGILFQTPIEIMDGFGVAYGFSWDDIVANCSGSLFLFCQYYCWDEIRIYPKFSFHPTPFAAMRPSLLGENLPQQFLKDYNGQTYWLAIDWKKFIKPETFSNPALIQNRLLQYGFRLLTYFIPAAGIGTENMIYARDEQNLSHGLTAYSQFYFSADINLESIPVKQRYQQFLLFCINKFHVCLPALEYNMLQGVGFHFLYF